MLSIDITHHHNAAANGIAGINNGEMWHHLASPA